MQPTIHNENLSQNVKNKLKEENSTDGKPVEKMCTILKGKGKKTDKRGRHRRRRMWKTGREGVNYNV